MAEYVVCFTISNDRKRASIDSLLAENGIFNQVDQSTRYGTSKVYLDKFILLLQKARFELELGKEDQVSLFYADEDTIKKLNIK